MKSSASAFVEKAINTVIEEQFSAVENTYELNYDNEGNVTSVDTEAAQISTLKANLSNAINKSLSGSYTAYIPVGNLLDHKLLNGYGFKVPVNLYFTGSATVSLKSDIVSAGVNQSKYRLVAVVDAEVFSNSLSSPCTAGTSQEYLLCETVLLGDVPMITR